MRWSCENYEHISTTTMYVANKLGRMVTCNEEFPPIESHDSVNLITWGHLTS